MTDLLSKLAYLFSEALRGFRSARYLSLSSILTIGICTSVFACVLMAVLVTENLGKRVDADVRLRVFMSPQWEDSTSLAHFKADLQKWHELDSVILINKEQALEEFKQDFGEELISSLDINPLPPSFVLYPKQEHQSSRAHRQLAHRLQRLEGVEEVSDNSQYLGWVENWRNPTKYGAFIIMIFIGAALAVIVHTAVKINLYARRDLVINMKYCGAGFSFILTPFVLEGFLLGLVGSIPGILTFVFITWLWNQLAPSLGGAGNIATASLWIVAFCVTVACIASTRSVLGFLKDTSR